MFYRFALLFLTILGIAEPSFAQGTTGDMIISVDSVILHGPASKKVAGYRYKAVVFLFDFETFRTELVRLSGRGYHVATVKETIRQLDAEIQQRDTAYFDQAVFDRLNWIPLEFFVCEQISKGSCLVMDAVGVIHGLIIRKHTLPLYNGRISWSGWRYFLPSISTYSFWQRTEAES